VGECKPLLKTLAPAPASAVAPIALALEEAEAEAAQVVVMLALEVAPPNARKAPVAAAAVTRRRYVPEPPSARVLMPTRALTGVSNLVLMQLRPPRLKLEDLDPPAAAAGTLGSAEARVTR